MPRAFAAVGHRGAPRVAPGNTLPSFEAAVALGCDWVECDCRAASDGIIVLAHDAVVTDRQGRSFRIDAHTAEELARLDLGGGAGVPTLAELAAWAKGRCAVMADVKSAGFEAEIGAALAPLAPERKLVPGADAEGRRRFRARFPDLPLSLSVDATHEAELLAVWDDIDTDAVTLAYPLITTARVADLHRRRIRVFAWTVDDRDTMRSLLRSGVDGLISNRADLLTALS